MQAETVQEGMKDLTRKLVELNPEANGEAIDKYFEEKAVIETRTLVLRGAKRIKKQFDLVNKATKESKLRGEPKWNDSEQTIEFTVQRLIQGPELPIIKYIPVVKRFSGAQTTVHFNSTLYMKKDASDSLLKVARAEVWRRETAPLENLLPYQLVKPLLGFVSNIIATVAGIVLAFPFTPKGLIYMTTALINTVFAWFYDKYADIKERSFPTDPIWANGHDANLPDFMSKTISSVAITARNLEQGLESQAKKLGIPVDDYKDKAFDLANDAIARGQQVIHQIQGEAQKAGQEVEKQVKDKADEAGRASTSGTSQDQQAENDTSKDNEDLPQTPFGGTDPTAPGAPSYAQATTQDSGEIKESDGDELPQTPLGGTDPTAPGAPSYAQATSE